MSTKQPLKAMVCAIASLAALSASANAQDRVHGIAKERDAGIAQQRHVVPETTTRGIDGCWTADQLLYGYRLSFCIGGYGGGTYHVRRVRGGRLQCDASLRWRENYGRTFGFAMERAHCDDDYTDWTADRFNCSVEYAGGANSGYGVAVPSPSRGLLSCMYYPAVPSHPPRSFLAYRSG
ncbi:MAG: hypothetical protein HC869_24225 [Rhodospirillales bacterium]|nr:hypothetical protein [Rhodospirillales bacterium]